MASSSRFSKLADPWSLVCELQLHAAFLKKKIAYPHFSVVIFHNAPLSVCPLIDTQSFANIVAGCRKGATKVGQNSLR